MALQRRLSTPDRASGVGVAGYNYPHVALVQDREDIGDFNTATGWTALGNDTTGLAAAPEHVLGTGSLEFDKVDGAANTVFAAAYCTITSLDLSRFTANDELSTAIHVSSNADVAYAFIRLGTSSSHYNEWRFADTGLAGATVWNLEKVPIGEGVVAGNGNGWNPAAVVYVCVGVAFDAQDDALADIKFDHLMVLSSQLTAS